MTRFRYFAISAILVFAAAFLWFVWPTRYRYDYLEGGGGKVPVRIDRLTGHVETFPFGYSEQTTEEDVPGSELVHLDSRSQIVLDKNKISCEIYNGSPWKLSEITVNMTIPGSDFSRDYKLQVNYAHSGGSLKNSTFEARLGSFDFFPEIGMKPKHGDWVDEELWSLRSKEEAARIAYWRIVGARGVRE